MKIHARNKAEALREAKRLYHHKRVYGTFVKVSYVCLDKDGEKPWNVWLEETKETKK